LPQSLGTPSREQCSRRAGHAHHLPGQGRHATHGNQAQPDHAPIPAPIPAPTWGLLAAHSACFLGSKGSLRQFKTASCVLQGQGPSGFAHLGWLGAEHQRKQTAPGPHEKSMVPIPYGSFCLHSDLRLCSHSALLMLPSPFPNTSCAPVQM
jgi:hypothetical protein